MILTRLKIIFLKVPITVFVMIMVLLRMKNGRMGITFLQHNMVNLVIVERLQKGDHQTSLQNGKLRYLEIPRKK